MKVRALFRPEVLTVDIDDPLVEVAERMDFHEVGAFPVLQAGELLGIITERDLVRAIAERADPATTVVGDYVTHQPVTVSPDTSVPEAASIMLQVGARHLPVVEEGKIVGIVSARDLLADAAWQPAEA